MISDKMTKMIVQEIKKKILSDVSNSFENNDYDCYNYGHEYDERFNQERFALLLEDTLTLAIMLIQWRMKSD